MTRGKAQHDAETVREAHLRGRPTPGRGTVIGQLQREAGNRAATLVIQRWKSAAGQDWDYETFAAPPAGWNLTKGEAAAHFFASDTTPPIVADALKNLTTKKAVRAFIEGYKKGDIKDQDPVPDRTPVVVAPPVRPNFPANHLKGEFWADPAMIRYSQDSIGGKFTNGKVLADQADALKEGRIRADDFPAINIIQLRTKSGAFLFMSVDNRRLWVFRTAGKQIRCQWIYKLTENDKRKMTGGPFGTNNIVVRDY